MNGHVIPNTKIAVDVWRIRGRQDNLTHFLTHLHGDHIVGLTSSWTKPIRCSSITALLLREKYGISNHLLHELDPNESEIIEVSSTESFTVTAFDANHCPGAVMFYFQGNFGNVLYTGDFRASETLIKSCLHLKGKIDVLYLDNTYCSPKCVFPSQDECINKIVEIIKQHPNHNVIIGVRKLGKEDMLAKLGEALKETIAVSPEMYKVCQLLFETNVFTTIHCHEVSRIRTMPLNKITKRSMQELNRLKPHIAIKPTAIYTGPRNSSDIFVVPYSDHSSYPELLRFVEVLKPAKVVHIVTVKKRHGVDISDLSCFDRYLNTETAIPGSSPVQSHLLINDQSESLPELPATPRQAIHNDCLNNGTHRQLRKRKRNKSSMRIKKRASGVTYEDSASDDSADRITSTPEPKNHISAKNSQETGDYVQEQSSCDATTEPGSWT